MSNSKRWKASLRVRRLVEACDKTGCTPRHPAVTQLQEAVSSWLFSCRANYNLGTVPRIQRRWVIRGGWCTQMWPTQDCHPGSTDVAVQALNWPAGRTFVNALPPPKSKLAFVKSVFSRPSIWFCYYWCFASSFLVGCHLSHTNNTLDIGQKLALVLDSSKSALISEVLISDQFYNGIVFETRALPIIWPLTLRL